MLFDKPPADFSPTLGAAACYIIVDGKFLLLKRLGDDGFRGKWGQPAGTMDKGELPEETIVREIFEETGIRIKKDNLFFLKRFYVRYPRNDFVFHVFKSQLSKVPKVTLSHEHSEYKWVTPAEALGFDLLPDEDECIREVFKIE